VDWDFLDLVELAGLHIVDESANRKVLEIGMAVNPSDLLADVVFQIFEGVEVNGGDSAGFLFEVSQEVTIIQVEHAAVGVIDDDDFPGAEQVMGNDQGAESVFGGDTTGVAYDVGIADSQAEDVCHGEAGVHAGEDGELFGGSDGEIGAIEAGGVFLVSLQGVIDGAHGLPRLLLTSKTF
jgi:hypothetical protein